MEFGCPDRRAKDARARWPASLCVGLPLGLGGAVAVAQEVDVSSRHRVLFSDDLGDGTHAVTLELIMTNADDVDLHDLSLEDLPIELLPSGTDPAPVILDSPLAGNSAVAEWTGVSILPMSAQTTGPPRIFLGHGYDGFADPADFRFVSDWGASQ